MEHILCKIVYRFEKSFLKDARQSFPSTVQQTFTGILYLKRNQDGPDSRVSSTERFRIIIT